MRRAQDSDVVVAVESWSLRSSGSAFPQVRGRFITLRLTQLGVQRALLGACVGGNPASADRSSACFDRCRVAITWWTRLTEAVVVAALVLKAFPSHSRAGLAGQHQALGLQLGCDPGGVRVDEPDQRGPAGVLPG